MYRYKVIDNKLLTTSVRSLILKYSGDGSPLLHEPGQYAAISLNDRERPTTNRCFSIASSSLDHRTLQFSIRVGGRFTTALERLEIGDEVCVRGPFGAFVFNEFKHDDIVLMAGGIGVAPFMSMIRYATKNKLDNKIHLIYSVRSQGDIPFKNELTKLKQDNSNLKISFVVGTGDIDLLPKQHVLVGRLDKSLLPELDLRLHSQTYMMCGPPPYMNAIQKLLETEGVDKTRILSEAFSLNHGNQTGKLKTWPFSMYALTGLSLLAIGFLIAANDLYKTLPPDPSVNKLSATSTTNVLPVTNDLYSAVNSLPPQVDTNVSQPAIIKTAATNAPTSPTVTKPTPRPVQITPAPIVVSPTPAPKTKTS